MNTKVGIALISSLTFLLGIGVAAKTVTSGSGGEAKLSLGNFKFEIQINEFDLPSILRDRANDASIKQEAKKVFGLYEIDASLVTRIAALKYTDDFSASIRNLRDRFMGPFNAPDINVEVKFSDDLDESQAMVCPDSVLYKNRINVALADFTRMYPVDEANTPHSFGCPAPAGVSEPLTISSNVGKKLLDRDTLPNSIEAIAKVLPSYVFLHQ